MALWVRPEDPQHQPCDYCGREAEDCICHLAGGFPDDVVEELDTDYLDFGFYEEDNHHEADGKENPDRTD